MSDVGAHIFAGGLYQSMLFRGLFLRLVFVGGSLVLVWRGGLVEGCFVG